MTKTKLPFFEKADIKKAGFQSHGDTIPVYQIWILPIIVLLIFIIAILRLFHLTMIKGAYYRFISDNNRVKNLDLIAGRGTIFDRNGIIVARSIKQANTDKWRRHYQYKQTLP